MRLLYVLNNTVTNIVECEEMPDSPTEAGEDIVLAMGPESVGDFLDVGSSKQKALQDVEDVRIRADFLRMKQLNLL